jgi:diguanylate cyclase (GGDEF)-like protein
MAYQLQVGVGSVLELIANQRTAPTDDQYLIDSIRSSLTDLFKAAAQCDFRTDLSPVDPATTVLSRPAATEASISTSLIAEALQDASEGAAILWRDGTIQHSNSALLAFSSSGIHSINGHTLSDILNFELEGFTKLLARAVAGIPWSGKVVSKHDSPRSYWISLSNSVGLSPQAPVVALVSDITEQDTDTEQELRQQAMHDKLTGLPNRRYFCEHLESLLRELKQSNTGADIAFIDLDDFKHVNDYTGHANGDLLLRALGERIQLALGPLAFVSRFGGDEFAVVMVDQDGTHSLEPYERLRQILREPFPLTEAEAQMSVSIGVTRFPEHGSSFEELMSGADAAMYAAKSLGKNQVVEFSHALQADIVARQQVRSKLRRALDDGEIELWFQPKVSAKSGQPVGCEALARWRTPSGEYIPPGRFVPIAEQTGLISPLGSKVFQLAAEQACCWRSCGLNTNIAVNVSPHQLRRPRFVDQLKSILSETGAQAEWFELEITENAVMEDVAQAVRIMDELSALGFRIAIDDFGTGYSSLSYLKNFSIHTLKIDLSFVRDLMRDDHSDAIVRSIISLGSGMKLTLVAEGVETQEQANFLREAGCDVLQGYLIGKPVPQQQYVQWLSAR